MTQEACLRCGAPRPDANPICTNCGTPFGAAPSQPGGSGLPGEEPTMVAGSFPPGAPQPEGQPGWAQPHQPPADPPTQQFPADSGQWGPPGGMAAAGQPGGQQGPSAEGQWGPPAGGQWGPPAGGQWGPPAGGQWGPPPGGPGGPGGPQQPWEQGPQGGGRGKIALIVGIVLLLVIGGAIAAIVLLGGDDDDDDKSGKDSPSNASVEDFCSAWDELNAVDPEAEDGFAKMKASVEKLSESGTPEGMGDAEREGFELFIELVNDADTAEEAQQLDEGLSEDDNAVLEAFFTYQFTTCSGDLPTPSVTTPTAPQPSDFPTDIPTDFPTGFPTDLPTDFPTDFNPSDLGLDEDTLRELEELESMLAELSDYPTPQ